MRKLGKATVKEPTVRQLGQVIMQGLDLGLTIHFLKLALPFAELFDHTFALRGQAICQERHRHHRRAEDNQDRPPGPNGGKMRAAPPTALWYGIEHPASVREKNVGRDRVLRKHFRPAMKQRTRSPPGAICTDNGKVKGGAVRVQDARLLKQPGLVDHHRGQAPPEAQAVAFPPRHEYRKAADKAAPPPAPDPRVRPG